MWAGRIRRGAPALRVAGLLLCGCSTITYFDSQEDGSTSSGGSSTSGASLLPTGIPPAETSPAASASTTSGFETDAESGSPPTDPECTGGFLNSDCHPDIPPIEECNVWDDDCPPGEKCNIWANDGGHQWNATRCVPLAPDPAGPEEPCTAEGSRVSGIDDCDVASVCLVSDSDTLEGTCMPMCVGSPESPTCEDPVRNCTMGGPAIPAFCRAPCHPLDPEACPSGSGCYPSELSSVCAPDASGPDEGALFDPCEYTNACDAGLLCFDAGSVGACPDGAARCCTPWCDLEAPACPDPTTCTPAYALDLAPAGQENVGFCVQAPPE